jgi:hypothetical protein
MERGRKLDGRQGRRIKVFLKARMLSEGQALEIHLLDISRLGALAHAPSERTANEIVWVVANGVEVLGRVAWTRGNRFGLNFNAPLPQHHLDRLVGA